MTDATTDGPTANHSYPSRPDLTNAVAVVVGAPSFVYPRGGHTDAMGTWRDATDDTAERFEPLLREFVALVDSSTPPLLRGQMAPASPQRYTFGPLGRGGMYEVVHYVVTVAPAVNEIADTVATWGTLGAWALSLKRGWRDVLRRFRARGEHPKESDQLVFSPPLVRAICLAHALEAYPAGGEWQVQMHGRHFGGGSPDLPSGDELYTVSIRAGETTYVYVLDGRASPRDHFAMDDAGVTALDLPDFADYVADPPLGLGEYMRLPCLRVGHR